MKLVCCGFVCLYSTKDPLWGEDAPLCNTAAATIRATEWDVFSLEDQHRSIVFSCYLMCQIQIEATLQLHRLSRSTERWINKLSVIFFKAKLSNICWFRLLVIVSCCQTILTTINSPQINLQLQIIYIHVQVSDQALDQYLRLIWTSLIFDCFID